MDEVRCPKCGEANPARAKFCLECGTPFAREEPPASRESRRTVTVVFADMVGFTTLGERLDQESLRRVMDRFYAEMRQAIEGEDGTLAKFIGDAVLAVWGTPEVREDDALRAVRAAEAMRRSLATLNEDLEKRWAVRVGMRTGVNTGEVVVDPARPADLLVGDTLNVAARLEQAARDGEVLIGPETQRLVRDRTVLEPVEPLALKGKSQPMPAWRLVDGTRPDRRAAPRLEAPLVGRERELRRLREAFDAAVAGRECRLVSVIGSPGLGKTRLVTEFARGLEGEATVLAGRCEASGEGITFRPVAEVVRMAAGIDEDDSADAARAKLERVLPESEDDRERIAARLAALLGLAPPTSTEETFWAVRRLLEAVGRERPVVLVHEDIHWGQPTFLDLLEYLVEWVRDLPLLIVALARPELREVRPRLAETAEGLAADSLALDPLDATASRALVDRLLGRAELPPELAERVLETTEGNPLFLGEMLRMLADDGVLRREGDTWVATGQAATAAVPPTIQALLAARIERLGEDERGVVERASVIGHQFYRGAVAELMPPRASSRVDGALTTLQRKELVRPEEAMWLDERVFRFHHVLIRDAAYRALLKEARADLHERFAAWLERKLADAAGELEEVVAFHLEQAHLYRLELGPLDDHGRELAARAAARLHSAGRRALAREDLPAAINLLTRVLAPLDDAGRPEVLIDLAEALLSAGDTVRAGPVVEELGLSADGAEDERLAGWATALAGQLDNLTGSEHVRETAEAATEAAALLAAAGDRAGEAKAHQVVAQAEALLGQVAAAEAALDHALVAARAAGDRRRVTAVLSGSPRAALWGPAPIVRASGRCLDVVRILRMTPGTRHVEAAALRCQAVLEAMRGRSDAARAIIAGCRSTFEELGLAFELHETAVYAGIVELLAGDAVAAEEQLGAAREGFTGMHVESGAAQAAALLARALLEQGRDDEALEATRFAEERGGEDLKTTIAWLGARAEALARGGAIAEALPLADRAVALAEPTDALADKADALMALARVRAAAGDATGAREAASSARDLYEQKDHSVGAERAAVLAGATASDGKPDDAAAGTELDERERALRGTAVGRLFLEFVRSYNERDWDAQARTYADDYVQIDHRSSGWGEQSRDDVIGLVVSWARLTPDSWVEPGRVHAQSEHVLALTWGGFGRTQDGVDLELVFTAVNLERDGRTVRSELFEPDDLKSALACFERLRFESEVHGTPVGDAHLAYIRSANERDWDAHRATFTDDYVQVDHRPIGWNVGSADESVALTRSWIEMAPDAHLYDIRLDAHSEHVVCGAYGGSGTVDGVEVEVALGFVAIERDGRFTRTELFEPDDIDAIRARFEELTAESGALAVQRRWEAAMDERDWDAVRALYDPDLLLVDRRGLAWEEMRGGQALVELLQAVVDVAPAMRMRLRRVVAASDDALAIVLAGEGESKDGGRFELEFGHVDVFADGRFAYIEQYEPDDEILRARFDELTAPGIRPVHPLVRAITEYNARAFNERRWDDYRRAAADDCVIRDLRLVADTETHGPDEMLALFRGAVDVTPGLQQTTELLAGEALPGRVRISAFVSSYHVAGDDGELLSDVRLGSVAVVRGIKATITDALEDDPEQILAHYDALRIDLELEATPVGRVHLAFNRAFNARDWDGMRALFREDYTRVDHRHVSWEAGTPDQMVETMRGWAELAPGARVANTRLDAHGEHHLAVVAAGSGTVDGSPFEMAVGLVLEERDGKIALREAFDPEDRGAMLACYERLRSEPGAEVERRLSETEVGRLMLEYTRTFNERDWEGFSATYAPDHRHLDRRRSGWEAVDSAGVVEEMRQWAALSPNSRVAIARVMRLEDGLLAGVMRGWGSVESSPFEIEAGLVVMARDGALVRTEVLDPDDEEALLTRFEELRSGRDERRAPGQGDFAR